MFERTEVDFKTAVKAGNWEQAKASGRDATGFFTARNMPLDSLWVRMFKTWGGTHGSHGFAQ